MEYQRITEIVVRPLSKEQIKNLIDNTGFFPKTLCLLC